MILIPNIYLRFQEEEMALLDSKNKYGEFWALSEVGTLLMKNS
jgi:hypothetical protein